MPSRTLSPRMSTMVMTILSPIMMLSSRCLDRTSIAGLLWNWRARLGALFEGGWGAGQLVLQGKVAVGHHLPAQSPLEVDDNRGLEVQRYRMLVLADDCQHLCVLDARQLQRSQLAAIRFELVMRHKTPRTHHRQGHFRPCG